MVNQRKYRTRVCFSFNTDRDLLDQAQQAAKSKGLTTSEYLTILMREDIQKNLMGLNNPLNLSYTNNINCFKPQILIPLDRFIESKEARTITNTVVTNQRHTGFANTKKIYQQFQIITTGKVTI